MGQTNECDRCGEEYEHYIVLVRDTISDLAEHAKYEDKNFCKPCRMAVTDYGAYLTESEREELEPKAGEDILQGVKIDGAGVSEL